MDRNIIKRLTESTIRLSLMMIKLIEYIMLSDDWNDQGVFKKLYLINS